MRLSPFWATAVACLAWLPAAQAADVNFSAADGQRIAAFHNPVGSSKRGVVLVHDDGGNGSDWEFFANRLKRTGFHTLAVDLRGHGASRVNGRLSNEDYTAMKADVIAAVNWLRRKGVEELILIGAGLGANLALQTAAEDTEVSKLVLLSPRHRVKGVTVDGFLGRYGERPVMIAVSVEDTYASKTSLLLDSQAVGEHKMEILSNAGSGTQMLDREPSLASTIQGFLNDVAEEGEALDMSIDIPQTDPERLTTEGEKLPGF
ncbi:MAG: alpha/beta fold hydrolase [Myxococcota bacterium]|nr:alpha/beta fold hydrolase [Myxococcota bacterium]